MVPQFRSPLSADVYHGPRRWYEICLANVVTLFFSLNYAVDKLHQLLV
jgi:hypothetical protein